MKQSSLRLVFYKYYTKRDSIELVIQKLKEAGASQMECTYTLVNELNMPLLEADKLVLSAQAWSGNRNAVDKLRKDFFDVVSSSKD